MQDNTKIVIVDDHSVTLFGIKNIIEEGEFFVDVVGTASSGKEALEILNTKKVDVLYADIEMNDIDGIELSKIVKKKFPHIKIIALTQHRERWILAKLINLNIDAIVLKSKIDNREILMALQNVVSNKKYFSAEINKLFFQTETGESDIPYLTLREKEILVLICEENIIKEIARKLMIVESTVESHRKNLCVKLKAKNQSGLVREAIRYGFYNFE